MKYKGKVDLWIGLAILLGIALPLFQAIRMHAYWLLALDAGLIIFMFCAVWPQSFETAHDALYIRAGLTKRVIPWSAITSVSPSSDSRSSLAMSMDRVLIQYADGEILIAPDDQIGFFDDVASHCPQLSRRGMDLVIAFN